MPSVWTGASHRRTMITPARVWDRRVSKNAPVRSILRGSVRGHSYLCRSSLSGGHFRELEDVIENLCSVTVLVHTESDYQLGRVPGVVPCFWVDCYHEVGLPSSSIRELALGDYEPRVLRSSGNFRWSPVFCQTVDFCFFEAELS